MCRLCDTTRCEVTCWAYADGATSWQAVWTVGEVVARMMRSSVWPRVSVDDLKRYGRVTLCGESCSLTLTVLVGDTTAGPLVHDANNAGRLDAEV